MIELFSIITEKLNVTGKLFKINSLPLLTLKEVIDYIQLDDFIILENRLDTSIIRTKDIIVISWQTQKK